MVGGARTTAGGVAGEAQIKHVTYLSVPGAERFPGVPHFIGKQTVENALKSFDTPLTKGPGKKPIVPLVDCH